MALIKQLLIEAILRFQPLAPFPQALQTRASVMSIPPRPPRPRTRNPRSTPPASNPSNPNILTRPPHHTNPPSSPTFIPPVSSDTIQALTVGQVQEVTGKAEVKQGHVTPSQDGIAAMNSESDDNNRWKGITLL